MPVFRVKIPWKNGTIRFFIQSEPLVAMVEEPRQPVFYPRRKFSRIWLRISAWICGGEAAASSVLMIELA
jgi:hypothetical protein